MGFIRVTNTNGSGAISTVPNNVSRLIPIENVSNIRFSGTRIAGIDWVSTAANPLGTTISTTIAQFTAGGDGIRVDDANAEILYRRQTGDVITVTANTPLVAWVNNQTNDRVNLALGATNLADGVMRFVASGANAAQLHFETNVANIRAGVGSTNALSNGDQLWTLNGNTATQYIVGNVGGAVGRFPDNQDAQVDIPGGTAGDGPLIQSTFESLGINTIVYYANPTLAANRLTPGDYRWTGTAWTAAATNRFLVEIMDSSGTTSIHTNR